MARFGRTNDLSIVLLFSLLISVIGLSVLNYRQMVDLLDGIDRISDLLSPKPINMAY
jgi:hypothetical protein